MTALFTLVLSAAGPAAAQSALFNIPTSEIVGERSGYVEADLDTHAAKRANGGWQSYGFSSLYGTSKRTEIGLNAYFTKSSDGSSVEFQPNFKYRIYSNETRGVSLAAGAIGYLPANGRTLRNAIASVYIVGAKKLHGDWAPKLSGGAYQLMGSTPAIDSKRGFLLGVEQPIHRAVTFIVDWNTGHNRFGYASAGMGIALGKRSCLYSAYYFGNEGRGNNSLGIYYGYSF